MSLPIPARADSKSSAANTAKLTAQIIGACQALFCLWFAYYATDWWSNPGQGAWAPAFMLVLLGWLLVVVEARRVRTSQQ